MRSALALLVFVAVPCLHAFAEQGKPSDDHVPEITTILSFYRALNDKAEPRIADFVRFFGPNDESEIGAILRLVLHDKEGMEPSKEHGELVNARLKSPNHYPSLFLACLRAAEPRLFAEPTPRRLEFPPMIAADNFVRFHVSSKVGQVSFVIDGETALIEAIYLPNGLNVTTLLNRCAAWPRRWDGGEGRGH